MKTPRAERLHIGILGKRNAGKSSLLNTITGQSSSIVSEYAGTTTDPIYKAMEIHGLGPVVFIDTAGYDDVGELGRLRVEKTDAVLEKCDAFILLLSDPGDLEYAEKLKSRGIPIVYVLTKADNEDFAERLRLFGSLSPIPFIKGDEKSKYQLLNSIHQALKIKEERSITGNLASNKSIVLLVTPQDIQAPKGRLILPQVQTIRELLDKKSVVVVVTLDRLEDGLLALANPPDLVITDSSCFRKVYDTIPKEVPLTSFSVLFSAYKGDLDYFIKSVRILDTIKSGSKILIAEACTHPPLEEDIGRVKIPAMLRKRFDDMTIDFVRGDDFNNFKDYDLIIQCGSCMFNRNHVLSRVGKAKNENIPMTNYGITIAYLTGILDQIALPK